MHNYVTIQPKSSSKERAGIIDEDRSDREGIDTLKRHPAKYYFVGALSLVLLLCGFWTTFRGHSLQPATFKSQENILENVAQVPRKVLVTGFLPFLNFASNPTGQVATLLNGTCHVIDNGDHPEVCFTGLVVDVSTEGAKEAVREAHSLDSDYSLVLHLGFESDAKGLKLEAVAANVLGSIENPEWSSTTANNPFRLTAGPIDSDSPWLLPTTAPLSCAWFALFQEYTRSSHAVTTLTPQQDVAL
jgi:hypothetical protein